MPRGAFWTVLGLAGGLYVLLIVGMLVAEAVHTRPSDLLAVLRDPDIRSSIVLSLVASGASALLSTAVAVPLGYVLSRGRFWGRGAVDAIVDIPIVLPPLVVGLSLLILFQRTPLRALGVTYEVSSVVIAQFSVAAAFATRTMKAAFDELSPRTEDVARTLGCTRWGAFVRVTLPEARRGILAAGTIAFARSIGEFGPVLVFSGATRGKTEVMATTVFLELSVGRLEAAAAVSLLMVAVALALTVLVRRFGGRR
jgi:molybdate transport system permease protein